MKDDEGVKAYSTRLMNIVNQIRLHGDDFRDHRVVEKILISLPNKFEAKVTAIEESCDLNKLTIAELVSKLLAHEQRNNMRSEEVVEGAF